MTGRLLDVSTLPFDQVLTCNDGSVINLREYLAGYKEVAQIMATNKLITSIDSFGFALAQVLVDDFDTDDEDFWDKPEEFVFFVGGWGPHRNKYIANAVRKQRPLLRYGQFDDEPLARSSWELCLYEPEFFRDEVKSVNDDGTFPWGDFPKGGAIVSPFDGFWLLAATSCFTQIEDHGFSELVVSGLGQLIENGGGLLVA